MRNLNELGFLADGGIVRVTRVSMSQIWTYVNSKLASGRGTRDLATATRRSRDFAENLFRPPVFPVLNSGFDLDSKYPIKGLPVK